MPIFKIGQKVRFSKRCQPAEYMLIERINANMFDVLYYVRHAWWGEQSLIAYSPKIDNTTSVC